MKPSLFRREALEAQQLKGFGEANLALPPTGRWLSALAVSFAVGALALGFCGQFTRKEHVQGFLAPTLGLIKLYPPQAGTVLSKRVMEGQQVRRGDVLLVISCDRASESTSETQAAMSQELRARRESLQREGLKQGELDALAAKGLAHRIENLQAELDETREQLALQQARVLVAQRSVDRQSELVKVNFVSEAALQEKQDTLLSQRQQLSVTQRTITSLERDLSAARTELASSAFKRSINASVLERQISELTQQLADNDARRRVLITAPTDGTVTTILAEPGQAANANAPLMSILPAGATLQAQLLMPTRAAGFVRPDQRVALRYQAFPYQRFGHFTGVVTEVGRTVIQPNEANLPAPISEPVYRVTVTLPAQQVSAYGQSMPLRAGMALDADIHVDRRPLIEWVLDPILAIAGRV